MRLEVAPMKTKSWKVEIFLDEREGKTYAEARLFPAEQPTLTGIGGARRNPVDREVPEIGDELAVARALSDLSHKLLDAAVGDIEDVIHEPVLLIQ
jgi:hypothetical protein